MSDGSSLRQAKQVFDEVRARAPEERAAFVAEACGDDAELRAEVESLLEHESKVADDFLRPPEPPPGIREARAEEGPDPLIGKSVGKYQIKSLIAAGGMGRVYEAMQDEPRRIVALKVMKRNVASRSALRRFQFESQVLARLRHPNIAQVYEAGMHGDPNRNRGRAALDQSPDREGAVSPAADDQSRDREGAVTPRGVPYFAMEYVPDARSITRFVEGRELDTRDRLRLFVKVCDAVHHGHQKGIIHRDLKPANILVDAVGEPKVIDFGVARATDSDVAVTTLRTDVGQLIGTLHYMSPEQCAADPHDIDTRSDVYSLGVVLYELLCGQLPYDLSGSAIHVAARAICERVPERPSAIDRKLRGDVEMIVLKALQKDRDKRYQSVADLAQDILRYLNHEPIEARSATPWTRTIRWVARHPAGATTAACLGIAALVVGATFVSVWILGVRPHKAELGEDYREARLLSINNSILHTWTATAPGKIGFAELVDRPAELGGGRVALLGFEQAHEHKYGWSLCAFDAVRDLDNPIWERHVETVEVLPTLHAEKDMVGQDFGVQRGWVMDVFPERPGREMVVSFACVSSARVLRICDLSGELLYQMWYDGALGSCYWMPEARLLVFTGDNAEVPWDERGYRDWRRTPHPLVVFAIRPVLGFIGNDYLRSEAGDGPLSPAWYKCVLPAEAVDRAAGSFTLGPPIGRYPPGRFAHFFMGVDPQSLAGVAWVIDEFGEEVPASRNWGDFYTQNQRLPDGDPDKLPDPETFYLGDLPPIQSTSDD